MKPCEIGQKIDEYGIQVTQLLNSFDKKCLENNSLVNGEPTDSFDYYTTRIFNK